MCLPNQPFFVPCPSAAVDAVIGLEFGVSEYSTELCEKSMIVEEMNVKSDQFLRICEKTVSRQLENFSIAVGYFKFIDFDHLKSIIRYN